MTDSPFDGLEVWLLTGSQGLYGEDVLRQVAAQALGEPLLHLHTQANRSLPWSSIDMDFMNLNQAAHGDREFAFATTRLGIERTTVVGHVDDPSVPHDVGRWCRAAAGAHALRT